MAGRKQTALDLAKLVDKPVMVKLQGGREVTGVLKVRAPPRGRAHGAAEGAWLGGQRRARARGRGARAATAAPVWGGSVCA